MGRPRGALLMTYGSPRTLERADVGEYLARIRGGREADDELVDEFTRRYRVIGGSPLIEITRAQAAALEASLGWPVEVGMRFSEPSIADAIRELAGRGVDEIAAIILSPQFSPLLMGGYQRAVDAARAEVGDGAPRVEIAGAWHDQPAFITALSQRLAEALAGLPAGERDHVGDPDDRPQPAPAGGGAGAGLPRPATRHGRGSGGGRRPRPGSLAVLLAERRPRAGRMDEARLRRPDAGDRRVRRAPR